MISVRFRQKDKSIELEIEDNGIGREKAAEIKATKLKKHTSLATSITRERIDALNKNNKQKITLTIDDIKLSGSSVAGTKVVFNIPEII
jgi:nitrate/nitrite-specific signal transduction histidine kinase